MDIRDMPVGWMPDVLKLAGEHGRYNLAIDLKAEAGMIEALSEFPFFNELRYSFWQQSEIDRLADEGDGWARDVQVRRKGL